MKENKVGTYSFVAEPFHVDFTGKLFMGVLGNHLLNCAGFHATERGFGMAELNESNYTWVLSRLDWKTCRPNMRSSLSIRGWRTYTVCLPTVTFPFTGRTVRFTVMRVPCGP